MDYEKFVNELYDGPLGDLFKERFVRDLLSDLEYPTSKPDNWTQEQYEAEEEWSRGVAEWLRDNYL